MRWILASGARFRERRKETDRYRTLQVLTDYAISSTCNFAAAAPVDDNNTGPVRVVVGLRRFEAAETWCTRGMSARVGRAAFHYGPALPCR